MVSVFKELIKKYHLLPELATINKYHLLPKLATIYETGELRRRQESRDNNAEVRKLNLNNGKLVEYKFDEQLKRKHKK